MSNLTEIYRRYLQTESKFVTPPGHEVVDIGRRKRNGRQVGGEILYDIEGDVEEAERRAQSRARVQAALGKKDSETFSEEIVGPQVRKRRKSSANSSGQAADE